ncbi:MAG: HAD family hydrolase [Nitrospiraceae bacterium]|nr:HAD family hydrolase [Nitrospiraceae bacterium]|tara:strand:+ start:1520 stop:2026 length:507 start_codon:yes stop_codon:yes gene_type:complete
MRELTADLQTKIRRVRLVAMDVDGVLTDGGMYYSDSGDEMKKFHSRDGMGIKLLQAAGIITAFVTSEQTNLVQRRGDRLKVPEIHQGTFEKKNVLSELCVKYNLGMHDVAFIGDDVNDLDALKHVGFSVAPADAVSVVKEVVDFICERNGGAGAVREMSDVILQLQRR